MHVHALPAVTETLGATFGIASDSRQCTRFQATFEAVQVFWVSCAVLYTRVLTSHH
jgi:hypothetical protein